jgi:hypothetical protein
MVFTITIDYDGKFRVWSQQKEGMRDKDKELMERIKRAVDRILKEQPVQTELV